MCLHGADRTFFALGQPTGDANMTDYPRFQWIDGDPSDSHRHYHGAPVVNLVLRIADWWLNLSPAAPILGNPDDAHISTSFVERQNLTMRMQRSQDDARMLSARNLKRTPTR